MRQYGEGGNGRLQVLDGRHIGGPPPAMRIEVVEVASERAVLTEVPGEVLPTGATTPTWRCLRRWTRHWLGRRRKRGPCTATSWTCGTVTASGTRRRRRAASTRRTSWPCWCWRPGSRARSCRMGRRTCWGRSSAVRRAAHPLRRRREPPGLHEHGDHGPGRPGVQRVHGDQAAVPAAALIFLSSRPSPQSALSGDYRVSELS